MLLIRGGRVIDPVREVDEIMDVMIEGSQIVETGKALKVPADAEVIDATGLVVAPGLMDAHVHFRDPGLTYKEDIETGAAAAARGGFTTVVCMANTKPVVDNLETLSYVQEKGEQTPIHVLQAAATGDTIITIIPDGVAEDIIGRVIILIPTAVLMVLLVLAPLPE